MTGRLLIQKSLLRAQPKDATGIAVASGPRRAAILVLLAAALGLMTAPALVAGISILDSDFLSVARAQNVGALLSYLAHAPIVVALPLAVMVARAKEDS